MNVRVPMKAMILAAGRGSRLAPLTDTLPKPLIEIGGQTLIERHLRRLAEAGFAEVVINVSYLADRIEARLGNGADYGLRIQYSREPDGPLETGGGIARALPMLGNAPFLAVNADVWTDYPFDLVRAGAEPAHLVLVANPAHHPHGDFTPNGGYAGRATANTHTYAGIGVYSPALFSGQSTPAFPLAPLLFELAGEGRLSCEVYAGRWFDIGTPERLAAARAALGA